MKDKCSAHGTLQQGKIEDLLVRAGLRKTALRVALLEIFSRRDKPLSQKDLIEAIEKKGLKGIDRVSIYRNLHQFVDSGIIHEVATNSYIACHHLPEQEPTAHLILFCPKCERHEEICEESEKVFFERLSGRAGFFAKSGQLLISGLCRVCGPA